MGVIRKVPKDCQVFFGWLLNNISREIEKHHAMRKCQFCKIVVFPYFRIFDILSCLSVYPEMLETCAITFGSQFRRLTRSVCLSLIRIKEIIFCKLREPEIALQFYAVWDDVRGREGEGIVVGCREKEAFKLNCKRIIRLFAILNIILNKV